MGKGNVKPFIQRNKLPANSSPTKQRLFMGVALAQQQNKALADAFDKEMVEVRAQIDDLRVHMARVIVRGMVTEQLLKDKLGLTQEEIDKAVESVSKPTESSSRQESSSSADSSTETCSSPQDSVSEQSQEPSATTCDHSEDIPVEQTCDRKTDIEFSGQSVSI